MVDLYLRDASWHAYSKPTGKTPRYHLPKDSDIAFARCSSRIVLIDDMPVDSADLKDSEICSKCLPEVKRLRDSK